MENLDMDFNLEEDGAEQTQKEACFGPVIPVGKGGYKEFRTVSHPNGQDIDIDYEVPELPSFAHELSMWQKINKFETEAWSPSNKGLDTGWSSFNKAFDGGLKPGFIVVAGDSNLG